MFEVGEKVVCINDDFSPTVRHIYKQLPLKDEIYTVRDVRIGRTKVTGGDVSYLVLLRELHNPEDPYMKEGAAEEMGFRSDRFAPLLSQKDEACSTESLPAQAGV